MSCTFFSLGRCCSKGLLHGSLNWLIFISPEQWVVWLHWHVSPDLPHKTSTLHRSQRCCLCNCVKPMKQNARCFCLEAWKTHAINLHLPLLLGRGSILNYNIQILQDLWSLPWPMTNGDDSTKTYMVNVSKYSIHGAYGIWMISLNMNIP